MAKTIFFCTDIDHADRMREALINENSDLYSQNNKYVMKITGDDELGKAELDNFITPKEKYPTLVTTSKLLTTGVDCKTCEFIVIDSEISSMIEFKQILGRGTRIREDYNKLYFTLIDFRDVSRLFADKDFDGEPVKIKSVNSNEDIPLEENEDPDDLYTDEGNSNEGSVNETGEYTTNPNSDIFKDSGENKVKKYYLDDVEVKVLNSRIQYYGEDGKLITESLKDYTKKNMKKEFNNLDEFLRKWTEESKREEIENYLLEKGIFLEELEEEVGKDMDVFDLICHIAFDMPPLTRAERANNVKKRNYFGKYSEVAQGVINKLLEKYENEGINNIEDVKILKLPEFKEFGSQLEIVKKGFGGKKNYELAIKELVHELYTIS